MKTGVARKILAKHLVDGQLEPGAGMTIRIDQTLTQDATGTMACLEFEAIGTDRLATEVSVSYVDHNTLQEGFENADDHRYLQSIAARYGLYFSRPGNGICHQVHLERFGRPGRTLLGSDSHTPTGGGIGMIAIGAGGLDVAVAMAAGRFTLTAPKVLRVDLKGRLPSWVTAKDVVLKMLRRLGTKDNVGTIIEYGGPGVKALSVPERATIANMGAEMGVTTSVFPSDEITRAFMAAEGREDQWIEITADEDADYDGRMELDLSTMEPLIATPHSPGNISTVASLVGTRVDQVCIGSCTNSSFADLMTVARMLEGKTVHPDVGLVVAPGSRQALQMISQNGGLSMLIDAGARIAESACGFCIGMGQAPRSDATSLRTSNRNFFGRSGTKSANVYLCSPEVAAAAAIAGAITDPRTLGRPPVIEIPKRFHVDDRMIIPPAAEKERRHVQVARGPNIGDPPRSDSLKEKLKGEVAIKVEDKITTDHIMPAGARMKYRSNVPKYSEFVFETVDAGFSARAAANRDRGVDNVIVAGQSYGQGSSREHAAICPMFLGVRAVIAKSIERIHRSNLLNFGIVPATFVDERDYDRIEQGDKIEIAGLRKGIASGKPLVLKNVTKGVEIPLACELLDKERDILLAGGMLNIVNKGA